MQFIPVVAKLNHLSGFYFKRTKTQTPKRKYKIFMVHFHILSVTKKNPPAKSISPPLNSEKTQPL